MKLYKYRDKRQKWLYQRGGRNESDVFMDEFGKEFIMMQAGNRQVRIYLPKDIHKNYTRHEFKVMVT